MTKHQYVNETEKFWKHSYNVTVCYHARTLCINADNEQDALDYAVDYAEEQGWEGYFVDDDEIDDNEDYITYAGNHGRPLISHEIYIEKLD